MKQPQHRRRSRQSLWHALTLLILPAVLGLSTLTIQSGAAASEGPHKLSDATVDSALISPDSRYVVYAVEAEDQPGSDLYRVSPGGDDPVKLAGATSGWFEISSDSRYVVYIGEREGQDTQLLAVPLDGGESVSLFEVPIPDAEIEFLQISPDGRRVVAAVGQHTQMNFGTQALFSMLTDGSAPAIQLAGNSDGEELTAMDFSITPDSQSLIYTGMGDSQAAVWIVPLAGGPPTQLSEGILPTLTPDGQSVVFVRGKDVEGGHLREVYSVPVTGGPATKLHGLTASDDFPGYQISPDSQWVVAEGAHSLGSNCKLYSARVSGTEPLVQLSADNTCVLDYRISPTSDSVIYTAFSAPPRGSDQATFDTFRKAVALYSIPIAGGPSVQLSLPADQGGQAVEQFYPTPDGQSVVYITDASQRVDEDPSIWSVPVAGGSPTQIGTHRWFWRHEVSFSSDGRSILYVAEDEVESGKRMNSLFLAPLDGQTPAQRISGDLPYVEGVQPRGSVWSMWGAAPALIMSKDGGSAIFLSADQFQEPWEQHPKALYSVPIAQPWYRTLWN